MSSSKDLDLTAKPKTRTIGQTVVYKNDLDTLNEDGGQLSDSVSKTSCHAFLF